MKPFELLSASDFGNCLSGTGSFSIATIPYIEQDSVISHSHSSEPTDYFRGKPFVDWTIALILMTVALPLIGLIAILIAAFDGRPIFYRQTRVGRNGRHFQIIKFRSMRRDAEKGTGAVWCAPNDTRITPLGLWLRKTHLDELPQLFNVLSGEMSIVGPRPERPEFVADLEQDIPHYQTRHCVRPGITGLAQISQGCDANISDVVRKVALDLTYIESASFAQDISILFLTIPYVTQEVFEAISRRFFSMNRLNGNLPNGLSNPGQTDPSSSASLVPPSTIELDLSVEVEAQLQLLNGARKQDMYPVRSDAPRSKMLKPRRVVLQSSDRR